MKDYTTQADELARKIAHDVVYALGTTQSLHDAVNLAIHSHTGSTLAELLADKERLDWLRNKPASVINPIIYDEHPDPAYMGKTLRQAIDQAMKEEK